MSSRNGEFNPGDRSIFSSLDVVDFVLTTEVLWCMVEHAGLPPVG